MEKTKAKNDAKTVAKKATPSSKAASKTGADGGRRGRRAPAVEGLSPEERERLIREEAYYRSERRGFSGGSPEEDWREAEREVDERFKTASKPARGSRKAKGPGAAS
jgi:hypothetical protein